MTVPESPLAVPAVPVKVGVAVLIEDGCAVSVTLGAVTSVAPPPPPVLVIVNVAGAL